MAAYDPVQDVVEEEGLDTAPRAQPVFQPDTPAYDPVQDVIEEEKPVFQPLHPDAQPDGDRPVFQSAHGPADAIELPAQAAQGETHIELTRPGQPFARTPLPEGVAPVEIDQFPGVQPESGLATVVPRAYTPAILAARQQAEQFGGTFARPPLAMPAQGAALQQAQQFAATQAAADQAQQNFVQQHAQAQVNSPAGLYNYANDLYGKTIGNFESLINTVRQGSDTDELMINQAVDQMLPGGSPEDKEAFKRAFIAGTPDQRSQWLGALMPYVSAQPIDTAALTDALDRKSDPQYQAAKAKSLKDAQDEANTLIEGDPTLKGTTAGNVISQIAALPAYALASGAVGGPIGVAVGAMVGVPVIFNRIFSDTWQSLKQQHPDWTDQQLDNASAQTAIYNTVGAEVGSRIVGAGLSPLLRNLRGGYLARAAVQVPATAAAQAGVGAATQAATNIAQGQPVGDSVLEAALGQGIVGGAAGAVHAAVHPPMAPEPTTGPSGARIRGPEAATLETGAERATAPPEVPPPSEGATRVAQEQAQAFAQPETVPVRPAPENVPQRALPPPPERGTILPRVEREVQPVPEPAREGAQVLPPVQGEVHEGVAQGAGFEPEQIVPEPSPPIPQEQTGLVAPTRQAITQRAFEISQERQRTGAEADALSDWNQAQAELAAAQPLEEPAEVQSAPPAQPQKPAPVTTAEEPWVSSIANKFVEPRVQRGEIGEVAPGQGYATQDLVDLGRRMRPEEVTHHMSDLMNNRAGDPIRQAAAIRYEEARLSERNQQLSRVAEANPGDVQAQIDAENAFKDLTDFHNGPLARQKNVWHAQGMSMQGEVPVDLSTYNGLREQWLRDQNGKAPPPAAEPVIRRRATQIRDAANAESAARKNAAAIDRYPEKGLPSDEDLRKIVMEKMGQIPCNPI